MRQEKIMWIVELNIAGYQFTRQIPDLRGASLRSVRLHPPTLHRRVPQPPSPHAA